MSVDRTRLDPEDAKIVTLARAARARNGTSEGAAVRDRDGRAYAATPVALPSLTLTALQAAVVMAASSGASSLEAAAVVTSAEAGGIDVAAVADLAGHGVPVHIAGIDGVIRTTRLTE